MNKLDWIAQMLLASVFLFDGFRRVLAYFRTADAEPAGQHANDRPMPFAAACAIALAEICGALGLVVPIHLWRPELLPMMAAAGLALLTAAAALYRVRRNQPTAQCVALFLLVVLVILGLWSPSV
jgi:hypothetical protein